MPTRSEREIAGHPYGIHRVLDKSPSLPQAADHLDNSLPIFANEILVDVEKLNIDSASFIQMQEQTHKDAKEIASIVMENCAVRGKQQNRMTGSGGMLLGRVAQVGSRYRGNIKFKVGDRIATLVSLSLTPLQLESIDRVDMRTHQMDVRGRAILFERTIAAVLPTDIPERIAMAVYDVAGAPATVNALCSPGKTLVVVGAGGKAGVLSCVAGRRKIGRGGKLIAIEPFPKAAAELRQLGVCNEVLEINAIDPIAVHSGVAATTRGKMGNIVINVASVPDTELSSILCARSKGKVVFFSMATSFTRVALGAEGIVSDATLIFGNGYFPRHSEFAINLVRKHPKLRALFESRYSLS